jgi:NTP pyrophosphatase (non-canonical NTP hydrolase)
MSRQVITFMPTYHAPMQKIIEQLIAFRDQRDWQQFHTSKDLAAAISIEAGELLELFFMEIQ